MGLLPYFAALLELSPAAHIEATASQGDTGRPGVAEQMLADARLEFAGRGTAEVINELPDLDLAVRALAAAGPSWPALQHAGDDLFALVMLEALRPLHVEGLGVRMVSEFGWIIGQVPSPCPTVPAATESSWLFRHALRAAKTAIRNPVTERGRFSAKSAQAGTRRAAWR